MDMMMMMTYILLDNLNGKIITSRWVGIKKSGLPKPALRDSGRPRTGL